MKKMMLVLGLGFAVLACEALTGTEKCYEARYRYTQFQNGVVQSCSVVEVACPAEPPYQCA